MDGRTDGGRAGREGVKRDREEKGEPEGIGRKRGSWKGSGGRGEGQQGGIGRIGMRGRREGGSEGRGEGGQECGAGGRHRKKRQEGTGVDGFVEKEEKKATG
jgi:hypothetical protein